ncbi:MAG: transporter [Treponema sp.]|jgi:spore maturation protein SpmB|nr:transporter [Treponema sp.]
MADKMPGLLPLWLRFLKCARDNVLPALSIIRFLLVIMLPVSFAVMVLEHAGILYYVAKYMNPAMQFVGLPGEAALACLSAIFMNIYSAIAVIKTLSLSGKQMIILASMCLIAHSFFVECLVMKKTGSSLRKIVLIRLFNSFLAGWILHFIVPAGAASPAAGIAPGIPPVLGIKADLLLAGLGSWFGRSIFLVLHIFFIVFGVMYLQRLLEEFGLMKKLGRTAAPLIRVFGLPANTAYVWIIANTVGLSYGAGILMGEIKDGALSRTEADLFNHHAAISHSQIEDTLLFVSLGVPWFWAALPRIILAIASVWVERARRALFRSSFRVKVV